MTSVNRRDFLSHTVRLALSGTALSCVALTSVTGQAIGAQLTDENLRTFLNGSDRSIGGIRLRHKKMLAKIYAERRYIPFWIKHGQTTSTSYAIINKLEKSNLLGLHPSQYYTQLLSSWKTNNQTSYDRIRYELVLTDSLYEYFTHLANGQLDEKPGDKGWFLKQSKTDVATTAMNFFRGDASFRETIDQLQPLNQRYTNLLVALREHHQILDNGGWSRVDSGPTLKPGHTGLRVSQLRARLAQSGDTYDADPLRSDVYDWSIEQGVTSFQERHGLVADGVIGKKTLAELNVPVEQRIKQIEVNLDRWRWLPNDLGESRIVVNTAGFDMDVHLNHNHVTTMNVVVGKPKHRTPIFSDVMEYLVFRPSWHVPKSITRDELLPRERANPGYLENKNFVAVSLSSNQSVPISTLAREDLETAAFTSRYRLRQKPGDNNALGSIKFMLPNQYSIYLHDTNAKSLFGKTSRAFSHGCIRLEDPEGLARTLLQSDGQDFDRIEEILQSTATKTVKLRSHIPVHMTYQTAWVDETGKTQFRKDIYDHDRYALKNYRQQHAIQEREETELLVQNGIVVTVSADI